MKASLERRFSTTGNIDIEDKNLSIATLLDPRFKDKFFKDKEKVVKIVIDELVNMEAADTKENEDLSSLAEAEKEKKSVTTLHEEHPSLREEIQQDFWQCFDDIASREEPGEEALDSDGSEHGDGRKVHLYRNKSKEFFSNTDDLIQIRSGSTQIL